jgi:predicted nucleic acid-binding Zn ribbon protein
MKKFKIIGELLPIFFRRWGIKQTIDEHKAILYWTEVVGQEISKNTTPIRISHGVLLVGVKDSIWLNELVYLKSMICNKLNKRIGKKVIKDIKFYLR